MNHYAKFIKPHQFGAVKAKAGDILSLHPKKIAELKAAGVVIDSTSEEKYAYRKAALQQLRDENPNIETATKD